MFFSTLSICIFCMFIGCNVCNVLLFYCYLPSTGVSGYLLCQFQWIFQDVYEDGSRNNRVCERIEYNNDNWKMNLKTWKASNKRKDWVKYHFKYDVIFYTRNTLNDRRTLIASILQIKLSFESFSMRFSLYIYFFLNIKLILIWIIFENITYSNRTDSTVVGSK